MSVRTAALPAPARPERGLGAGRGADRGTSASRGRRRRLVPLTTGAVAALAAGLALGGCSSSGSAADARSGSSAAGPASQGAGATLTAADFASRLSAAQKAVSSEHMVVKVTGGSSTTTTTADIARRGDALDMVTTVATDGETEMEVRLLDGVYYFSLADLSDGKFITYDPKHPESLGDLTATFKALGEQVDPSAAIDALGSAVVSVQADGAPGSDGVQQYTVVADTSKIGGVIGDQLKQAAKSGGATAPATLTYRFGVDAQDRIRTMTATIGASTSSIEFSKFGEKVTVEKPSADQTITAAQLGS